MLRVAKIVRSPMADAFRNDVREFRSQREIMPVLNFRRIFILNLPMHQFGVFNSQEDRDFVQRPTGGV